MDYQSISISMQKLCDEFPKHLKIHQDMNFTTIDLETRTSAGNKDFRVVAIQDIELNHQHAAIIVDRIGVEFEEYPKIILDFINQIPSQILVTRGNSLILRNSNNNGNLVFTKIVFLYTNAFDVEECDVIDFFARKDLKLIIRDPKYWSEYMIKKTPDVFICHDARDKERFVSPLVHELTGRLIKVWYDEYSLSVGDSLVDKIDEGLRQCEFGIVIISENFLTRKKWTNREFRSLTTKEIEIGKKVILPIWLGVSREQVAEYSLDLVDKFALNSEIGIQQIAEKIIDEIRKRK
ncbi:MAG: toll/interleukin-1 receptor domain-containing protein [Anaerolineales bacterium]|nr:toll/interleukin-1 receptor domain-containing protein [Anaerolineales bacterium]MBP6209854.1 toll/interleukin-1 receptor domain-containing protein [Anaerolineales bacterium]